MRIFQVGYSMIFFLPEHPLYIHSPGWSQEYMDFSCNLFNQDSKLGDKAISDWGELSGLQKMNVRQTRHTVKLLADTSYYLPRNQAPPVFLGCWGFAKMGYHAPFEQRVACANQIKFGKVNTALYAKLSWCFSTTEPRSILGRGLCLPLPKVRQHLRGKCRNRNLDKLLSGPGHQGGSKA